MRGGINMKITKKTALAYIIIIIVIGSAFYFITYAPQPPQNPHIDVMCQKTVAEDGIYFDVLLVNNEGVDSDVRLGNFELGLRNSEDVTAWDLIDIKNALDGPKFSDNDGDELLSIGDTLFIPLNWSSNYNTICLYYYPTAEGCFEEDL